jgi:membrane-bound serine protease (ClpP class)
MVAALVLSASFAQASAATATAPFPAPSAATVAAKAAAAPKGGAGGKTVVIIPVEEEVDFGLHAFLQRAVAEALAKKPDYILFKVNTYGGELKSAFDIVDLLMGITQCSTYVFVEQKAISAGALISLAANRIAMGKGTTIGDCAPITQGGEGGIVMLGEKIQSPLRAKFRTLAERNGYPSLLSEAMVSSDIGVVAVTAQSGKVDYLPAKQWENLKDPEKARYKSHKIVVPDGKLLTMTDNEAKEYGFSQGSYDDIGAFLSEKGWRKLGELETTWSENMVRVIGKFAGILMLIGFGALYMEFKTPGLSVFGFIGIACLAIVFGSKYVVGLANYTELLLLLAGFALFLVEIYLFPGTFIAGTLGLVLMIAALTLSLQSYTLPNPQMPWELENMVGNLLLVMGMAVLAIGVPLLAVKFVLPNLPRQARVISTATLAEARSVDPETQRVSLGLSGVSKTPLKPTGKAMFGHEILEVSSRGEFIPPGEAVEVCQIVGNKILVRKSAAAPGPGTRQEARA